MTASVDCPERRPTSLITTDTPTATATVGPELPLFRPTASATVPATPTTSAPSWDSSSTEPAVLETVLRLMALRVRLSTRLTAAEPAPAIAPVAPVPRAADAATPTPSVEMLACSFACSVMSSNASTFESSMSAVTVVSTSLIAMPTPMASAPVLLFCLVEAA